MTLPRSAVLLTLCLLAAPLAACATAGTAAPPPRMETATGVEAVPPGIKPLTVEQEETVNAQPD